MRRTPLLLLLLCLIPLSAWAETMPPVPTLEPLPPEPVRVLISAAGDCTLGGEVKSGIDARFARCADQNGLDYFLADVRDIFAADDFTLVNLEGPLTTASKYARKTYVMRGDPAYAAILSGSSVEVANLANNHARDFGEDGFRDTLAALEGAGVAASGGDILHVAEKDGLRIGFVGFEKWNHSAEDALRGVTDARSQCDLLIVSVHWGEEYDYTANADQRKLGRALIDAGADLVIGTHPHVIQGIERYQGKYIVYSLGNFCFGGNTDPSDQDCYIFQQAFLLDESGVSDGGIRVIPCAISSSTSTNDYRPTPLTGERAEALRAKIAKLSDLEGAVWLAE
ncbi:MAG: CapA family protein [Clostridia bacterium]|nr:CapA family protein [Clostridia bacterium]